ncbi:response regulator [Rubellimicrobium rubrum]|uniref:Response regulator n=1 Tax=Rubellimicrobium rubrum TaxID=2585369 RepID=A0A5C4MYA9_9RHOB|nr:response regulator [Rubellimicrobium rubrum]TNC49588.1 response regulator [Rubellimicrobium rubrum]
MADLPPCPTLEGCRVLVVEDDFVVAEDLQDELEQQGAEVLGPVATVEAALSLLESGPLPERAILDVNLRGTMVFPVADALRGRGIPFVFVTGYDHAALPAAYAGVSCCEKPTDMPALVRLLMA